MVAIDELLGGIENLISRGRIFGRVYEMRSVEKEEVESGTVVELG